VSTNSLANGSGDSEEGVDNGDRRASMDVAIDKFKERTKRNGDSRRNSKDEGTSRLRSLLGRSKRGSVQEDDGLERRLSALSGEASNSNLALFISGNRSNVSLPDDSGHSSLMTDDNSDTERYVPVHVCIPTLNGSSYTIYTYMYACVRGCTRGSARLFHHDRQTFGSIVPKAEWEARALAAQASHVMRAPIFSAYHTHTHGWHTTNTLLRRVSN